jgi:hypothetical protein
MVGRRAFLKTPIRCCGPRSQREVCVCPLTNAESALGSDEACSGISRLGAEVVEPRISAMLTLEPLLAQPRTVRNTI